MQLPAALHSGSTLLCQINMTDDIAADKMRCNQPAQQSAEQPAACSSWCISNATRGSCNVYHVAVAACGVPQHVGLLAHGLFSTGAGMCTALAPS